MKKYTLTLLLTAAPLFAGVSAPMAPAPSPSCDCPQGFTLGLEVLALSPYQSEGAYDESDRDIGFRGSLGYEFDNCVFTKLTGFIHDTDIDDGAGDELEVSYFDLVVGQHFQPCDGLTLSPYVGGRWASFEEWTDDTDFDGIGIVAGIDGTRALAANFSLYGTVKQSIVFGEESDNDADQMAYITELGLGLQYDFSFSSVAANVRAGVEGQWWGGISDDDSESAGLAGFVLGANFRF